MENRVKPGCKTLDADMENENMGEDPMSYTTAYEIRIVKTLCAFIAANVIILLSFTLNRLQAAGLGLVHGYIMGMIMSYLVFGITCKKRDRRIVLALGCGMLGFLAALDWRFETALALFCSLLIGAATFWCLYRDKGKADGGLCGIFGR
jgi:NhaP-type Na+/H+ and K+/H+ antiporter